MGWDKARDLGLDAEGERLFQKAKEFGLDVSQTDAATLQRGHDRAKHVEGIAGAIFKESFTAASFDGGKGMAWAMQDMVDGIATAMSGLFALLASDQPKEKREEVYNEGLDVAVRQVLRGIGKTSVLDAARLKIISEDELRKLASMSGEEIKAEAERRGLIIFNRALARLREGG